MVLLLDAYHLGDPLFLPGFARDVAARVSGTPLVLVHGGGEAAERALEAEGLSAARTGGVLAVQHPRAAEIVERAARELNREIVHALNEAGVPAVRFTGADRGLLRPGPSGVEAQAGWLKALADQGAVPVVAALVRRDEGAALREVSAGAAAAALAHAMDGPVGLLGARAAGGEGRSAAWEADRLGIEVVRDARSGWNRGAGVAG